VRATRSGIFSDDLVILNSASLLKRTALQIQAGFLQAAFAAHARDEMHRIWFKTSGLQGTPVRAARPMRALRRQKLPGENRVRSRSNDRRSRPMLPAFQVRRFWKTAMILEDNRDFG
jgi:hypothetical protein